MFTPSVLPIFFANLFSFTAASPRAIPAVYVSPLAPALSLTKRISLSTLPPRLSIPASRPSGPQGRSARVKPLRYFVALTLVAGVCLTGRAVYLHAKAALAGVLIRRAWQVTARSGEPHPPWPWADTHPVARLRIPRLGHDE